MNVDIFEFLRPVQCPLSILAVLFLGCALVKGLVLYICGFIEKRCMVINFNPKTTTGTSHHEGNTSILFKYPAPITGRALHAQMNAAYFDAIYSAFLRSLQRAGYRLSDREPGIPPLLSGPTIDALAREVDRARQEFMTVLGTDIKDDVDYHMESGRAPKFLIQLIDSCERLGWKVVPAIQLPEDECVSSFSVSP